MKYVITVAVNIPFILKLENKTGIKLGPYKH